MMRILALALSFAAWAGISHAQEAPPALTALHGCWVGTFEGVESIRDERCISPMLAGRAVRDVHFVRPTDYAGEAIFYFDHAGQTWTYLYLANDGGRSGGPLTAQADALVFAPHDYVGADGRVQRLRSIWRIESADAFVIETERLEDGAWTRLMRIAFERTAALSPPESEH